MMLFAAVVVPTAFIKGFPQGFITEMVPDFRIDFQGMSPVPIGAANHMMEFFQGFCFQLTPEDKLFLLLQNIILPQQVTESNRSAHITGDTVGIVLRQEPAKPLNAGHHVGKLSFRFHRIHHRQGMVVFYTPAVNHIRLERTDFFPEVFFQFRYINMGRCFGNGCIAAGFIDHTRISGPPVENSDSKALTAQTAEHMIHPVDTAGRSAADMGTDHAGSIVAKPQQFHFLIPFL